MPLAVGALMRAPQRIVGTSAICQLPGNGGVAMSEESDLLRLPVGVEGLLQRAVQSEVLGSVESMALVLSETGWARGLRSGSWSYVVDPLWSVESAGHPPALSIFVRGSDALQERWTASLHALLNSGQMGPLCRAEARWSWNRWFAGDIEISVSLSRQKWLGPHRVPAMMQLAVERADAPPEGLAPDPECARRRATEGSSTARWYLAGEDILPDDVVELLAADDDPSVVVALQLNEEQRRIVHDGL